MEDSALMGAIDGRGQPARDAEGGIHRQLVLTLEALPEGVARDERHDEIGQPLATDLDQS